MAILGHNMFLGGGIGTGKTVTLKSMVYELEKMGKKVAVTASTGLASKQIEGTIHDKRYGY